MAIIGRDIGPELIDILGLPKKTTKFTLTVVSDDFVRIDCEYMPEDCAGLVPLLARYELVERKDSPPALMAAPLAVEDDSGA